MKRIISILMICLLSGLNSNVIETGIVTDIQPVKAAEILSQYEEPKEIKKVVEKPVDELIKEYNTGWTTSDVNIRKDPDVNSDILGVYSFNTAVYYYDFNNDWVEIKYGNDVAYISKYYISDTQQEYKEFDVPSNSGFKSYMSYECITSTSSPQYKLQQNYAYTGTYGIRQVDGRYCAAIGSYFTTEIGTFFDLVLENGTVIPCILADQKADKDTDEQNIVTMHNGCLSEFVVDSYSLSGMAKQMGDISYCNESWNSPVKSIRVYVN